MRTLVIGRWVVGYDGRGHRLIDNGVVVLEDDRVIHVGRAFEGAVDRTVDAGRFGTPVEMLLIAGRERLIPAVLDHVEFVSEPALVELHGIDSSDARLDAGALEVALERERDPLLVAGRDQDLEGEGRFGRAVAQHRAVEIEPLAVRGDSRHDRFRAAEHALVAQVDALAERQEIVAVAREVGEDP